MKEQLRANAPYHPLVRERERKGEREGGMETERVESREAGREGGREGGERQIKGGKPLPQCSTAPCWSPCPSS